MKDTATTIEKEEFELDLEEMRRYELGFHLIPSLSSDEVSVVLEDVKANIVKEGGEFLEESPVEKQDLAYSLQKDIDRTRHTYTESYFGWMHFIAHPSFADALKLELRSNEAFLRVLIIKIVEKKEEEEEEGVVEQDVASEEPVESSDEEVIVAIDKEIDKLVEEEDDTK
jgi:ribosomal protein S6